MNNELLKAFEELDLNKVDRDIKLPVFRNVTVFDPHYNKEITGSTVIFIIKHNGYCEALATDSNNMLFEIDIIDVINSVVTIDNSSGWGSLIDETTVEGWAYDRDNITLPEGFKTTKRYAE